VVAGVKDDLREHYTPFPAGTILWHVYPSKYEPRAFNPSSRNRFALLPPPDQSMFYAGDSSACPLWEAVLRNLVVDDKQPQHVDPALVEGRSIVRLKLLQEIPILDLRAPHFRRLSANTARHTEWQRLCVIPERDYGQTHSAARELLTAAPRAAGLSLAAFLTIDAFKRPPEVLAVRRASASVHPSRIATVLSCSTRKSFCSSQVRASAQSAHRRYCVTLTQGSNASGPCISRTTLPKEISSPRRASWYPPLRPR
jgi:RES domain